MEYNENENLFEDEDIIYGQEYSVKDRCQQIGITFDNVRYRIGPDRFKWMALLNMLKFRGYNEQLQLFDDFSIDIFFQKIVPNLPNIEYKNPLACILVYYSCIIYEKNEIQFQIDDSKLNYIQKNLMSNFELLFQMNGLKYVDLIRYIRLFQTLFPTRSAA